LQQETQRDRRIDVVIDNQSANGIADLIDGAE
jgi:hypothetical protein